MPHIARGAMLAYVKCPRHSGANFYVKSPTKSPLQYKLAHSLFCASGD